ncbi:MAG: ATP-dependent sacrificial sulfur transferase LarE [Lachnospiraceae bacterium]|nr:ATP-dependent sacrificial sulfur transferase LarE [Lachnospiraceae bacterium]
MGINIDLSDELKEKYEKLEKIIRNYGSLAVGFSGGVDSTLLLTVAADVLGDRALAVTNVDAGVPERELREAREFCESHGIRHVFCETNPLEIEQYRFNSPDRCYYCKRAIFERITELAKKNGMENVAEGSNVDDEGDYRPGLRAVAELGIKSPLREAGLSKRDIREISKSLGLPTGGKPSYACLASRFVYGEEITKEKLRMIDLAEQFLIDLGFAEERVRLHGDVARIEVNPSCIERIASEEIRTKIYDRFREIGFRYVSLDLKGYRVGSMNDTIKPAADYRKKEWQ